MDLDRISRVGTAAAYAGGGVLKKYFGQITDVRKKGRIDLVTRADTEAERKIIDSIREIYPDHAILAEESGALAGTGAGPGAGQWIVDPLDGTTNFAHGVPICAVSIAFSADDQTQMGIVFNPFGGEFFSAIRGRGARLNGASIHVSRVDTTINALLATGFPYDPMPILGDLMARFAAGIKASQGIRRLGAAALDLCHVACGRFDGFWEQNLKPWDTAAGALIVTEAGGQVTDFNGQSHEAGCNQILATNGRIHSQMVTTLSRRRQNGSPVFSS